MSHYAITKVKIKNPNMDLLKRAVENLAREKNGQIVGKIEDYYGEVRNDFDIGVRTPKLYRGIGIRVNSKGEVEFVGDYYLYEREVERFKNELVMEFNKVALEDSFAEMGITVEEVDKTEDAIKLKVYDYEMGV